MERCRFYFLLLSFLLILVAIIPGISASEQGSLVDFFIDNWIWFAIGFLAVQALLGYVLYRVIRNKRLREQQMARIEEMSRSTSRSTKSKRKSKKQSPSRKWKHKRKMLTHD